MTHTYLVNLEVKTNPWKHESEEHGPETSQAQLVCVIQIHVIIEHLEQEIHFRRTHTHDELWTTLPGLSHTTRSGLIRQTRTGSPGMAAEHLLKRLLRAKAGYEWPTGFVRGGLISATRFSQLLHELENGFEQNAQVTRNNEAPIVSKARALELDPLPSNTEVGIWKASCPGGHSGLELNNKTNSFYCGYCKRGGDEQALIEFTSERVSRRQRKGRNS